MWRMPLCTVAWFQIPVRLSIVDSALVLLDVFIAGDFAVRSRQRGARSVGGAGSVHRASGARQSSTVSRYVLASHGQKLRWECWCWSPGAAGSRARMWPLNRLMASAVTCSKWSVPGPLVLIFVSFSCSSCLDELGLLTRWQRELPIEVCPVVSGGSSLPAELREGVLLDQAGEAQRSLDMPGNPSTVLLGAGGLLAGGPVLEAQAIRQFIEEIARELAAGDRAEPSETDPSPDRARRPGVRRHAVDTEA